MSFSITQKLVAAFLAITAIVLLATLLLARWSFEQGFLDYVNALEQKRLNVTAAQIEELYLQHNGNWQTMQNTQLGHALVTSAKAAKNHLKDRDSQSFTTRPPPHHNSDHRRPPRHRPPHNANPGYGDTRAPNDKPAPATDRHPPPPPHLRGIDQPTHRGHPPHRGGPHMPPTAVHDANNQWLFGAQWNQANTITVPIMIDGQPVGYLHSVPKRVLSSSHETEFAQQQLQASITIAAGALLLTAIVSMLFARALLSPINRLISAVNKLANGDFELKLDEQRQDELGNLIYDVNHLANTLKENQNSRKRLLADISHELRTPITILTGELEVLRNGYRQLDIQQLDSFAEEVDRLNNLVNDLYELAIADVGALRYQYANMDLSHCIRQIVNNLNSQQSQIEIQCNLPAQTIELVADQNRIQQLLLNLLRNSLHYTDFPGEITVSAEHTANQVIIDIHDSPPSVVTQDCAKLFEPMYRQDESRKRGNSGAGLGLAISKNIVQAHDGTISAAPSPLGGLHIKTILPLTRS